MEYLNQMLIKVEDIASMISFANRLVAQLEEHPLLKDSYTEDVKELVQEYNNEVTLLKRELERYFILEKRNNLPVNLSLHRAYEQLKLL